MDKDSMIQKIRQAQRERDPRKRDRMWDEIWEAGLPANGTVITGDIIGHVKEERKDASPETKHD